ncbi:MAG: hypothetical protein ACOC44_06790 [Promethearchaeia archaeon]
MVFPKYDDVGSFPLPEHIDRKLFNEHYWLAYQSLINDMDIFEHRGIKTHFIEPMLESFQYKMDAGVEVINYPQHMEIYKQFLKPISDYEIEPDLIEKNKAIIPEVLVIDEFAKQYHKKHENANPINLKICLTGPLELYIKKHDFTIYYDLAMNLATSINRFIQNSLIDKVYLKTTTVSIDEPSFGYTDLFNVNNDEIVEILDKSVEGVDTDVQIHLHTLNRADLIYRSKNIDILTCEYASDHTNIIPKRELIDCDKHIRVGVTRTNIDGIIAEKIDQGEDWDTLKTTKGLRSLIDSREQIKRNLKFALSHYGDRLQYVGPDCGLSSWKQPNIAFELLERTSDIISSFKK